MSKSHKNLFKAFRSGAFSAMLPKSIKSNGKAIKTTKQIGKLVLKSTKSK